jgi:hypothetical protein
VTKQERRIQYLFYIQRRYVGSNQSQKKCEVRDFSKALHNISLCTT